jgi:hypothetical protein
VDDLRIWHTARSPEQIAANYNTQILSAPDLTVSLTFDQPDLGLDSSTNSNNAVVQGSVTAGPGSMCRGCAAGTFTSSVYIDSCAACGSHSETAGEGASHCLCSAGYQGGSAEFPGSSDSYLEIANHGLANSDFTIEFWVQRRRAPGAGTDAVINQVGCGLSTTQLQWSFGNYIEPSNGDLISNNAVTISNSSFITYYYVVGGTPAAGSWAHIVFNFDSTDGSKAFYQAGQLQTVLEYSQELQINGKWIVAASPTFLPVTCTQPLRVGSTLLGLMDELRVWHTMRSPEQIATNYRLQILSSTGLIASLTFDDGNNLLQDSSGSQAHVTVTGSVASGGAWECQACQAGTFKSSVGPEVCADCVSGQYQDGTASGYGCKGCPVGNTGLATGVSSAAGCA